MDNTCRLRFHEESEALVNKHIALKLNGYYQHLAQAAFYERDDVALKGFAKYFRRLSCQDYTHAKKLSSYQHLRGGRIIFHAVERPADREWPSPLVAIERALHSKKTILQSLLDFDKVATSRNDAHLSDFLKKELLIEMVTTVNKLASHHTNLKRVSDGLGVFLYDQGLDNDE